MTVDSMATMEGIGLVITTGGGTMRMTEMRGMMVEAVDRTVVLATETMTGRRVTEEKKEVLPSTTYTQNPWDIDLITSEIDIYRATVKSEMFIIERIY